MRKRTPKGKATQKAAPAKHPPFVEGLCLARGDRLREAEWRGEMVPHCWRGGKCKSSSCGICGLCPTCQCECGGTTRSQKRMRFPADGGKGLSGAPKKKDKPVSTGTKRRSAAVASGSLIRKLFKEDHVQLPCTGSSPKLPAELANDKACWHGSEVLHADGGDGEHECPEERAPAQESKVVEEEPSTSASIHSLGAECGVNTPKGVRVIDSAWSDATPMQQSRGYTLVKSIMLEACKRVCPGDAQAMMDEIYHNGPLAE